ncbi:hypothetical protein [Clostridium sp. UBA7339]|uniref:hypothetical protein n=1 Tax=Clostridium sp. UBA7339 TaxID=1946376 RepID=UPI003216F7D6
MKDKKADLLVQRIDELIKKEDLTARETMCLLTRCQNQLLRNMPINESLDSKFNWFL